MPYLLGDYGGRTYLEDYEESFDIWGDLPEDDLGPSWDFYDYNWTDYDDRSWLDEDPW